MCLLSGLGEMETPWSRGHQAQSAEEGRVLDTGERSIGMLNANTSNLLPCWVSTKMATISKSRSLGKLTQGELNSTRGIT